MAEIVALEALAARVAPGQSLAIPVDGSGVAMAATAALLEAGIRDLKLICVPISGMQADLLIGAGAVASLETSAVSLGEAGAAPRFTAGIKSGAFAMRDSTCPAIYAGLLAAQKGVPFMPIAGIIGSDLLNVRSDWQVIDSPVGEARKVVVVPAISPDVALFHAPEADRAGNVRIGRHRELADLAYASKRTLVTWNASSTAICWITRIPLPACCPHCMSTPSRSPHVARGRWRCGTNIRPMRPRSRATPRWRAARTAFAPTSPPF